MESLCSEDHRESATCCCACSFPFPTFCKQHEEEHQQKAAPIHFILPLAMEHEITSKTKYVQALPWLFQLNTNFGLLKEKTEEFTKCEELVEQVYEELVTSAAKAKKKLQRDLSVAKRNFALGIDRAIAEVQFHALESYDPPTHFQKLLWARDASPLTSPWIVSSPTLDVKNLVVEAFSSVFSFNVPDLAEIEQGTRTFIKQMNSSFQRMKKEKSDVNKLRKAIPQAEECESKERESGEGAENALKETVLRLQTLETQFATIQEALMTKDKECTKLRSDTATLYQQLRANEISAFETTLQHFEIDNGMHYSWNDEELRRLAENYGSEAEVAFHARNYEKAAMGWRKKIDLLCERFPREKRTAEVCFQLGSLLIEQWDRYSEAEGLVKRSLEIEYALNPYSADTTAARRVLVNALIETEKYAQAKLLLKGAIEQAPDKTCISHFLSLAQLSLIYAKTDRIKKAKKLMRRFSVDTNTSESEVTALTLKTVGLVYLTLNKNKEAEKAYQDSVHIYMEQLPNSKELAITLNNLACLFQNTERYLEAEEAYAAALSIYEMHYPSSKGISVTLYNSGLLSFEQKRYEEAEVAYFRAWEISQRNLDSDNGSTAMEYYYFGRLYNDLDNKELAIQNIESAYSIWTLSDWNMAKNLAYPALKALYLDSGQASKLETLKHQIFVK